MFCLVVELGGVGRAAEHLFVAQPVVSEHLRTLQDRLGAQLLYREGRRTRLTEAGETAYAWAKEVLTRSQEMVREIEGLAEGDGGRAIVASSMTVGSYLLPPILNTFAREHPRAELTVHVADPESALHAAETGAADFAVVITDVLVAPRAFTIETIGHEALILVAGGADGDVGDRVSPKELKRLRYICSPRGISRRRLVDAALRSWGVGDRNVVIELGHPEAMKHAVRDGLGVALLARSSVQDEFAGGTLRHVEIAGPSYEMPIMLARRTEKRLTPLQQALIRTITAASV